jgi:transcriptional regulator with XRE-family HTH domain
MAQELGRSEAAARRDLARRLRGAREAAQVSQVDAALALGIRRAAIPEIESELRNVRATELPKVAKLYGVSVTYLLGEPSRHAAQERAALAAEVLAHMDQASLSTLNTAIAIVMKRQNTSRTFMKL